MRVKVVFGLLLAMFIGWGVLLATRTRTPHLSPAAPVPPPPPPASASVSAPVASSAPPPSSVPPPTSASAGPTPPVKLLERPLRVLALGWEVAAPSLLANGGAPPNASSDFAKEGLEVSVGATESLERVESALARGGADKDGADVAILPMCQFAAAYERLRALSPQAFFVTAWSRGREAVISSKDGLLEPTGKGELKIAGTAGEPAAFLALFTLELQGFSPSAIRFVPAATSADEAQLAAVDRDLAGADSARQKIWLTTADASHLVAFVAIAPSGFIEKNEAALAAWAKVELAGAAKLAADAPGAARQIASTPGAPDPLALLRRSGETAAASLADNQRMAGLTGKSALTLEGLFLKAWSLWRGAGVLATPAPQEAPVTKRVIAAVAKGASDEAKTPENKKAENADGKQLVVVRAADDKEALASLGLLAEVFDRSPLRAGVVKGGNVDAGATKKLIEVAQERYEIAPGRVTAAKKAIGKGASVEVLAAP